MGSGTPSFLLSCIFLFVFLILPTVCFFLSFPFPFLPSCHASEAFRRWRKRRHSDLVCLCRGWGVSFVVFGRTLKLHSVKLSETQYALSGTVQSLRCVLVWSYWRVRQTGDEERMENVETLLCVCSWKVVVPAALDVFLWCLGVRNVGSCWMWCRYVINLRSDHMLD